MINECEDKLICDLAETYHILNYRELSPDLVATLVLGLSDNSRVKMHLSKAKLTIEQMLFAMAVDNLNFLCWAKTEDARKHRNKPKSILQALMGNDKKADELQSFASIEEYNAFIATKRGIKNE